jgi:hypothetical protein
MATTIEQGSGATPRMPSTENYASAMQAMVSAVGAKFDINEIVRLYTESSTSSDVRQAGSSAPRAGVPSIAAPAMSMDDAALMIGELQSKLMDLMSQQQTGEIKSNQIDMKKKNAQQMEKVQKWLDDLADAASKSKTAGIFGGSVRGCGGVRCRGIALYGWRFADCCGHCNRSGNSVGWQPGDQGPGGTRR